MSIVELIPVEKGNRLVLDNTTVTTIGRTANIGCLDKKISRNHAELYVKSDGTLWIKPIHHNPTFYRTKDHQLITLPKDQEFQLNDNDEIGLLPNEYFYRISIQSRDKEERSSTIPKSPVQEHESSSLQDSSIKETEHSSIRNHDEEKAPSSEPEGGVILHTARALPVWMSSSAAAEPKKAKGRGKSTTAPTPTKPTPSPSKYRTYVGRKKAEGVMYDDDEEASEELSTTTVTSTNQTTSKDTHPVKRERCPYGKFCYRKNPAHRQEAIHPGDPDWDNKENDIDDNAKPECPYGIDCYRKNPDHLNEYSHTKKRPSTNKPTQQRSKRKANDDDDEEDDDDGLPNEYDYSDSFIDDDTLDDSARIDRTDNSLKVPDGDWKPHRKTRHSNDDDDENDSTDESEISLLKDEAAEFIQDSSINKERPAKKKARVHIPVDEDDD